MDINKQDAIKALLSSQKTDYQIIREIESDFKKVFGVSVEVYNEKLTEYCKGKDFDECTISLSKNEKFLREFQKSLKQIA